MGGRRLEMGGRRRSSKRRPPFASLRCGGWWTTERGCHVVRRLIALFACFWVVGAVMAAESAAPVAPAKKTVEQLLLELTGDGLDLKKAAIAELTKLGDPRVVQLFDDYR